MLILLVEDHRLLAETLIDFLATESIETDYAANGMLALQLATEQSYDALILDINLPGMDGYSVCRSLREDYQQDTPILMLTARDELQDKLTGFAKGADDYLIKPFDNEELLARLHAMVKRHRGEMTAKQLTVGSLQLDAGSQQVRREGQPVNLSPTGFNILKVLMREYPDVVSRAAIEQELWGDEAPDSDALRSHIYTLRKAVDQPFAEPMIKTVKGVGICLSL